jgi:hypothetical protein
MSLPVILFFARGYQADYFPTLRSDRYRAVFVTLTRAESRQVRARGADVAACFEEEFAQLPEAELGGDELLTSWPADRFLGRFDHAQRRRILAKETSFWRRLLQQHKPAAVVNELVAIEISEVLLTECRRQDVRYLAGMNCVVDDYFYWLQEPLSLSGKHLSLPEPGPRQRALAEAYLQAVRVKDYKPFYVQNLAGRRAMKPLLAAIARLLLWSARSLIDRVSGRFRYEMYQEEYGKKLAVFVKSLVLRYDELPALPPGAEVVFYPLHQEPEATLNYMSEFYANQVATIENILKCLGPTQVLVVKEHPVDKGALLRTKFQRLKAENSALYFLPAELHGREVLRLASRVVTLTSTVGWEAAILGKPVYVLGQIFYDHARGVQRVDNLVMLKSLLRAPAQRPQATAEDFVDFIARMTAGAYPGNPFPHEQLYSQRNHDCVVYAICDGAGL